MSKYPTAQERARRGAAMSAKSQQSAKRHKGPLAEIGVKVGDKGEKKPFAGATAALSDLEKAWGKI